MGLILLFTIIGFLSGLSFVMIKRKIRPGKVLSATFLSLLLMTIARIFKDYIRKKNRYF